MIFPPEELAVIDLTIRMFVEPVLEGDTSFLGEVWQQEQRDKQNLLNRLGVTAKEIGSNEVFAAMLREVGIEPELKAGKNDDIYAFAASDQFMKDLLINEDEDVVLLAETRIAIKSNIDISRAARMGWMATRGAMAIYLSYAAAHTTRWGGGDKLNFQNMRRLDKDKEAAGRKYLRRALKAPAGHAIIKADKSQIECRILNYLAGQWDVIERFRNKEDPYVGIASKFYGRTITKSDPAERGVGKQLELSCGYGAGGPTIRRTAARGTYGPPVQLSDDEAIDARDLYRSTHPGVCDLWKQAGRIISRLAGGEPIQWGPTLVVGATASTPGHVVLPNGAPIWYPGLEYHRVDDPEARDYGDDYWRYQSRKGWVKLYGAKLVENWVQALSRIDMSQCMLRLLKRGLRTVLTEHDALAVVVPIADIDKSVDIVREEMTRAPAWLPDIPLDCEITVGERYS